MRGNNNYTDLVSEALNLKRSRQELGESKETIAKLQRRLAAADRAATDASVQHAADISRVERQRDEFRELLKEKTNMLASETERAQKLDADLTRANETIARLEREIGSHLANPLHVHVRQGNAYDALLDLVVTGSSDQKTLVDWYRNDVTHTSNMTWQTFLNETMKDIRVFVDNLGGSRSKQGWKQSVEFMVDKVTKVESLQPPLVRYVQRHSEFEKMKTKKMTKAQMADFRREIVVAFRALGDAFYSNMTNNQM